MIEHVVESCQNPTSVHVLTAGQNVVTPAVYIYIHFLYCVLSSDNTLSCDCNELINVFYQ